MRNAGKGDGVINKLPVGIKERDPEKEDLQGHTSYKGSDKVLFAVYN